jgi:hypothetical protein
MIGRSQGESPLPLDFYLSGLSPYLPHTFDLPQEKFNMESIANAAAVYDWPKDDGYYYLMYAGRNEGQTYAKRGWNQIAPARSKDLIHWPVPGE